MSPNALVLENDPSCPLARIEGPMATRGISAEVASPGDIGSLPDPGRYDLVIILGSDDSAYDDSVLWVAEEFAYARRAVESDVPILGVCFGAQMLARALDGEVRQAPAPEVGWKSMTLADQAAWLPPGPWLTWHMDTFDWPPGSTPLAWTDVAPQAFSHGGHLGLQFHPEAPADLIEQWLEVDRRTLALRGLDHDALLAESRVQDDQAERAAKILFERYFDRLLDR
jgi:GMP synthase-like glutamine amidotransferase